MNRTLTADNDLAEFEDFGEVKLCSKEDYRPPHLRFMNDFAWMRTSQVRLGSTDGACRSLFYELDSRPYELKVTRR